MKFLTLLGVLFAASGQSVPDRVFEKVLAPCCWRENLAVHRSQTASDLRAEVTAMAQSGRSEKEILDQLVLRYGVRILREPPGKRATLLYALPVLATLLGVFVLVRFVRRQLKPVSA